MATYLAESNRLQHRIASNRIAVDLMLSKLLSNASENSFKGTG